MTPVVPTPEPIKVAVRCDDCKRIVAYKIAKGSGRLQLKCPKCGCEIVPTYKEAMMAMHRGFTRHLMCPNCNKRTWCKKVLKK